ncbi:MAG TPA: NAD-dependent epimerase/dehydratase family protein [Acidimicrobiia bacterium]|jgi:UDP-glucose 4-epimerase|nr:NAD-dependent epimerase/dehydratase family protein [Acidimicrobiia bacterium]
MKVVVTGGAGFIGSNLCEALAADPVITEVVALDDLSNGFAENLVGIDAELVVGSILDAEALDQVCDGAAAIVHLAARGSVPKSVKNPVKTHERNATGTLMVMEAARRHGGLHTVVASSSSVYGATPDLPKHEDLPTRPMSPYAVSKVATEWYALAYQHSYDLPSLVFRFFNVYGPRQPAGHAYAAVIPAWISAAMTGETLRVNGDGKQSRDFTYVDTVTWTLVEAVKRRVVNDIPVNLAFGGGTTLLDLIAQLEDVFDRPLPVEHAEPRPGDIRHSTADPSRLFELFPDVQPIDFDEGLAKTLAWWQDQA